MRMEIVLVFRVPHFSAPSKIMRVAYHSPIRRLVGKPHARFLEVSL
jgi:hypothetical protein